MEDVKAEELTPEVRELLNRAAALVERAIETHSLACRCFICWQFASGENAKDGFVRATMAVIDALETAGAKAWTELNQYIQSAMLENIREMFEQEDAEAKECGDESD